VGGVVQLDARHGVREAGGGVTQELHGVWTLSPGEAAAAGMSWACERGWGDEGCGGVGAGWWWGGVFAIIGGGCAAEMNRVRGIHAVCWGPRGMSTGV
jgi:hypothetical protein